MATMQFPCVFCGEHGTECDHDARPAWLRPLLPTGPKTTRQMWIDRDGVERLREYKSDSSKPVPTICLECREKWMTDLDVEASRVLKPMLFGAARLLSDDQEHLIAFWAVMTALTLSQAAMNCLPPEEHYRRLYALRELRHLPPATVVRIAKYRNQPPVGLPTFNIPLGLHGQGLRDPFDAYRLILVIKHLIIEVEAEVGDATSPFLPALPGELDDYFFEIGSGRRGHARPWPPTRSLDEPAIQKYVFGRSVEALVVPNIPLL